MNYDIHGLGASTIDTVLLWTWAPESNLQNSHKQTQIRGMFLQVENWRGRKRGILADHWPASQPKPAEDNAVKNKVDGFKKQHPVLAPDLYIPIHPHTHMHITEKHTSKHKGLFPCRPALYSSSCARKLMSKLVRWSLFSTPRERELI